MKLRVFHSADGDCLLLSSTDGHHALIDGGRSGSFRECAWPTLEAMSTNEHQLDLLVVSHIDADHITGILWLLRKVADWALFDHQTSDGQNPDFAPPRGVRPPEIKKIWHNSWRAQLGDLEGPIESLAMSVQAALAFVPIDASAPAPARRRLEALENLAESIPQGHELLRVIDDDTPIPRNAPFDELVLLRDPPHVEKLGKTTLKVIGPATTHLERLRDDWRTWIETEGPGAADPHTATDLAGGGSAGAGVSSGDELTQALAMERADGQRLVASLAAAARIIHETDPTNVTPPNRASIMLLAEEKKRTCLLTGDAAEEEIIDGLTAAGHLVDGRFRCNVLKVQHHGSEHNLSLGFAKSVIADDYVFCADGASGNPDPSVVKTLIEGRAETDPSPFTLWFNCSPRRTQASRRTALRAAIREATRAADRLPGLAVRVLDDSDSFFDIPV